MVKVNPYLHPETYIHMENSFRNIFVPALQSAFFDIIGHKVSPVAFKYLIGNIELAVAILVWGSGGLAIFASIVGFFLMIGACTTHILLKEDFTFPLVVGAVCVAIFTLSLKGNMPTKKTK